MRRTTEAGRSTEGAERNGCSRSPLGRERTCDGRAGCFQSTWRCIIVDRESCKVSGGRRPRKESKDKRSFARARRSWVLEGFGRGEPRRSRELGWRCDILRDDGGVGARTRKNVPSLARGGPADDSADLFLSLSVSGTGQQRERGMGPGACRYRACLGRWADVRPCLRRERAWRLEPAARAGGKGGVRKKKAGPSTVDDGVCVVAVDGTPCKLASSTGQGRAGR
jgi:hypothetical protein